MLRGLGNLSSAFSDSAVSTPAFPGYMEGGKVPALTEHLLPIPAVLVLFRDSNFEENHEILLFPFYREKMRFREVEQFAHGHTAGRHCRR